MDENWQIPVHFETEGFNHRFLNSTNHSDEFLLPSARSQDDDRDPVLNEDLDNIFQQLVPVLCYIKATEEIEAALRILLEIGPHSYLSATSVQNVLPEPINEGLEGAFEPQINLDTMRLLPPAQDLSQFAVVLELLDIPTEDLERRLQYRRVIRETIKKRQAEMAKWKNQIDMEIDVTRHEERQLRELLVSQLEGIRAHCRARLQEFRNGPAGSRAILENFPQRYNAGMERLGRRVQHIENTIQIQNERIKEKKARLEKKYEEGKKANGKKCLYYYEACFVREVKRGFEFEKDLRDAFVEFIREIKPREEEERILKKEPMMREIYTRGDTLMELMHWVELKEDEGPLKVNEKVGFVRGTREPMRIALTIDKFFVIYTMDMANREFDFWKQIKLADVVELRTDERNLNVMIVKELKNRILWNKEIEFSVDLGSQVVVEEFIQDFTRMKI